MEAADEDGMAASFMSPPLDINPGFRYNASFKIKTKHLVPIPGGAAKGAATPTGSIYLHFFDVNNDSGAWNPQFGDLAPSDTAGEWQRINVSFVAPTTAKTARIHIAFAAHTFTYTPNRMLGGRATGNVEISDISFIADELVKPLPTTIRVPDATLQTAVDQAFACLHNSKQSGNFTVGAGYTISGNISPDLTFGLHGIRRTGHESYVSQIAKQWEWHAPDKVTGEYTAGRVMGQIYWPLGVDNIFSFSGDIDYLKAHLPLVDASLRFVNEHSDDHGLVTLVEKGKGHMGGGADWVDWYNTRLDGRSFNFHQWYVRTLRRVANLHNEFAFGNKSLAKTYQSRASTLQSTLQTMFWQSENGYWLTNADYPNEGQWLDDSVWSIYHGIADANQTSVLLKRMDSNTSFYEGVPARWTDF